MRMVASRLLQRAASWLLRNLDPHPRPGTLNDLRFLSSREQVPGVDVRQQGELHKRCPDTQPIVAQRRVPYSSRPVPGEPADAGGNKVEGPIGNAGIDV